MVEAILSTNDVVVYESISSRIRSVNNYKESIFSLYLAANPTAKIDLVMLNLKGNASRYSRKELPQYISAFDCLKEREGGTDKSNLKEHVLQCFKAYKR